VSVVVEVSARTFTVPQYCACCGATPEAQMDAAHTRTTGVRVIREHTRSLAFPYCSRCLGHATDWSSAADVPLLIFWIGVALGVCMGIAMSNAIVALIVGLVSLVISVAVYISRRDQALAQCELSCAAVGPAVKHLGWSGSISSFAFASPPYAIRFADGNVRKLVNVSMELRRFLEQGVAVPQIEAQVAQPEVGPPRMPPPAAIDELALSWIARIESYKGAEARRHALARALDEVTEPRARWKLMSAASRIELTAVLDKVDSLATVAAKRRHLQKAITDMRSDVIPDELQAGQLQELERRLRELGPE